MQVGFIGLGTMGAKMAASLQKAGYRLVVHDLRRDAATPHLAAGAVWADTARQVAEASDVVFTSLPAPAVRQGALGRTRTFDVLINQFLPGVYDPPAFALRLAHKDVSLATALGRELQVPMPMANLALDELTTALNRGWGERDSRAAMLLQQERAGVHIAVDPERLRDALERDAKAKT